MKELTKEQIEELTAANISMSEIPKSCYEFESIIQDVYKLGLNHSSKRQMQRRVRNASGVASDE